MMKITICIILLFLCAFGQPKVEIGFRATRYMLSEGCIFSNCYFNTFLNREHYWGLSTDLIISFTKNLYFREGIVEIKKFDTGAGGTGLNILSGLDADLVYVLPFFRRISPLIYAGIYYENVWGKPYNDWRAYGPKYEYRFGIGLNYAVRDRLNISINGQLFTKYQYYFRDPLIDAMNIVTFEMLGFPRIDLGCRLKL
ncbi:hypothetical protein IBX73_03425 [candidate division WOR-3 bacterium]|nr:hypothetical protein [candidate division WOR-3 bacterium]